MTLHQMIIGDSICNIVYYQTIGCLYYETSNYYMEIGDSPNQHYHYKFPHELLEVILLP